MAQLKQDEWPNDDEPTTSEVEGDAFKTEQPRPRSENARRSDRSGAGGVPPRHPDGDAPHDPS
jgi:hypothetical protein